MQMQETPFRLATIIVGRDSDDKNANLEQALALAPSWDSMYISRHERGWIFVGGMGIRYAFDDGDVGWLNSQNSYDVYEALGARIGAVYVERSDE